MLHQCSSRIASQIVFQLTWCFRKTFLITHTRLELPKKSKWLPTERSDLSYLSVLQQQPVRSQEHQSSGGHVFHHVHGLGRQPTDCNHAEIVAKSKAATPWEFVVVEPNHSWWWPFKSPTNRKEARTSSACTAAIDASKQSKIRSSYVRVAIKTVHIKILSHTTKPKNQNFATATLKFGLAKCSVTISNVYSRPTGQRHLARHNKTERPKPGTSTSNKWRVSETKVSEHNSISYWDEGSRPGPAY